MMKQSAEKTTSKNAVKTVIPSIWRTAGGKYSLIMLAIWLVVSAISLVWTPYSLLDTDGFNTWASPSGAHMLGTDGVGADVLSWLMAGSRTNLAIALLTVVVAAAIGLLLVAAMVSRHGALASTSVVVVDALISIPTVLIALMLSVPFGASAAVIIAACGLAYGLNLARILRPAAMLAARSDYVESALWSGASSLRVFFTHIVPNTVQVLCVQLSMSAGTSLLAEAGLTYLGVGVGAGVPSWGHSLATSVKFISIYPMAVVWPGLVVTLMVIALNLFGGSGKSMIAKSIMGLLPLSAQVSGSIDMGGTEIVGASDQAIADLRGRYVGMVFQNPSAALNPVMTVAQQVALPLRLHYDLTRDERLDRVKAMFAKVRLPEDVLNKYPHELSGGQQQRVGIAAALVTSPRLIIADEPTTALDSITQRQIVDLLASLVDDSGASMLFITHDFAVLNHATTRCYVLADGRVAESGQTADILQSPHTKVASQLVTSARALSLRIDAETK